MEDFLNFVRNKNDRDTRFFLNSDDLIQEGAYLSLPQGSSKTFVPMIQTAVNPNLNIGQGVTYYWNTSSVPLGVYYICLEGNDSSNRTTACSPAAVRVN